MNSRYLNFRKVKRYQTRILTIFLTLCATAFIITQHILKDLADAEANNARLKYAGDNSQGILDKPLINREGYKWNFKDGFELKDTYSYRKQVFVANNRPIINQVGIDCKKIVHHNQNEILRAKEAMVYTQDSRKWLDSEYYKKETANCEEFRHQRGYIEHPLSQTELDFPLAFTVMVYRDIEQAERLFRAIYRPHNYYCFHLDSKMDESERTAVGKIVDCFDNVFITDKSVDVKWGEFSVLEAELSCMNTLWPFKRWIYYINLTGQEFPLKTNREIVAILKALDGANIVDGTWIRAKKDYFYRWKQAGKPPPHKIQLVKGSIHIAVNRYFVDFALHDSRSRDFLEWLKNTQVPDETFFASLNHNPQLGIIGSFLGEAEEYPLKPFFLRYKNWELGHSVYVRKCSGKYVRNICILGIGDLHRAYNDVGLFANKFHMDFEHLALDCLEELMHEKTWTQYLNDESIDTSYFSHLDYVKRKLEAT